MRIAIVTDAWQPQVNGVVTTLGRTRDGLEGRGHEVTIAILMACKIGDFL